MFLYLTLLRLVWTAIYGMTLKNSINSYKHGRSYRGEENAIWMLVYARDKVKHAAFEQPGPVV